jgi:hypothetical protein
MQGLGTIVDISICKTLTELMLGSDGLVSDQRFALTLVVDCRHPEIVLFAFFQSSNFAMRSAAEFAHRSPLTRLLVSLLDYVMADWFASIVL